MKNLLITAFITASALCASAQAPATAEAKDTITDRAIVPPESFDFDTYNIKQEGYMRRYADLDSIGRRKTVAAVTDEVYIDRLQRLPTVIDMPYNDVVRQYIDLYAVRKPGLVERVLGASLLYMPIFEDAVSKYNLPAELKYLPIIESALKPGARSKAGAVGLWQLMPGTASDLGLEVNSLVDQRRDPYASTDAALRYLKRLYDVYGDWSLAIAAYNCGPGNVNKAITRSGVPKKDFWTIYNHLPRETKGYVPSFIAANYIMHYFGEHGISPVLAKKPIVTDTVHVNRRVHFDQISEVLDIPIDDIRALNPQYVADIIPGNIHTYTLTLPSVQAACYVANEDSIVNHNSDKYARPDRVEPGPSGSVADSGEYIETLVVKYHTVRRGENLNTIAKKYGVSASEIRRINNIKGSKVKRGRILKINTYERRYVAPTSSPDSLACTDAAAVELNNEKPVTVNEKPQAADDSPRTVRQEPVQTPVASTKNYTVKKGDNLSKIAKKYGVTVDAIRKLNKLKDDNIQAGQRLKIPVKGSSVNSKSTKSKSKSGSKKKSSKKRRR